jgi:hypothetical protein
VDIKDVIEAKDSSKVWAHVSALCQEFCDSTFLKSFMTGAGAALGAALADK